MTTEKRGRIQRIRGYLREFSDGTTLHGIRYVGEDNRHISERLCWVLALVLCTALCTHEMNKIWTRWNVAPVITTLAQNPVQTKDIAFPAVTICHDLQWNYTQFDIDQFVDFKQTEQGYDASSIKVEPRLTDEDKQKLEAASLVCSKLKYIRSMFTTNEIHLNWLQKFGAGLKFYDKMSRSCTYNSGPCDLNLFRPILTERGVCLSFNLMDYQHIFLHSNFMHQVKWDNDRAKRTLNGTKNYGEKSGLTMEISSPIQQLKDICHLAGNNTARFHVFIHSPEEFPALDLGRGLESVEISPGMDVDIKVNPIITTTDPELKSHKPEIRGCRYDNEMKFKKFKSYSTHNCELECESYHREVLGNCKIDLFPKEPDQRPSKNCYLGEDKNMKNYWYKKHHPKICSYCLPACDYTDYEVDVLQKAMQVAANHNTNESMIRFSIYFKQREYLGIHRKEVFSFTDVLSNCGGLLGLFTGFSVITLIEVLYFATLRLVCNFMQTSNRVAGTEEKSSGSNVEQEEIANVEEDEIGSQRSSFVESEEKFTV